MATAGSVRGNPIRDYDGRSRRRRREVRHGWVTREHPHTDRIACPWLVHRFIDGDAVITYVPRDEVLPYAERTGAVSFDAPGATYTHRDGLCSFEVIVEEYKLGDDPALALVAKVVHGSDVSDDADITPELSLIHI